MNPIDNNYTSSNNDYDRDNFNNLKGSDFWDLTGNPILIDGSASGVDAHNWTWAASQSWCRGSGNNTNPFILENITIDCQGHGSGITIQDSYNYYFIIRNCSVLNAGDSTLDAGIKLSNIRNGTIINNNCSLNNYNGIYLYTSSNTSITGNCLFDNKISGICISYCTNITLSGNQLSKSGLFLEGSTNIYTMNSHNIEIDNTINGNSIYYYVNRFNLNSNDFLNPGQIILVNCNHSIIDHQELTLTTIGILLYSCKNITISDITILNSKKFGVELINSNYNNISKNSLSNNNYGIRLENSKYNQIKNNTISECNYGITLIVGCNYNNLTSNKLNGDLTGIESLGNINTTINNNTMNLGHIGINDRYSFECKFMDNNLTDFSVSGIYSFSGHNHSVIRNILYNSSLSLTKCENFNLSYNKFYDSGLEFDFYSGEYYLHSIETTNLVNDKPLYYYKNRESLNKGDFLNAGQIILVNCNDSFISNQDLSNTINGIALYQSFNNTIFNNTTSKNQNQGIYTINCSNININHNYISYNNNGIKLEYGNFNSIKENYVINNNDHGIHLKLSNYNRIERNNININRLGVFLESSNSTYIAYNTLADNAICFEEDGNCYNNTYISNECLNTNPSPDSEDSEVDNFLFIVFIIIVAATSIVTGIFGFYIIRKKRFSIKNLFQNKKKRESTKGILVDHDKEELIELFRKNNAPESLSSLREMDLTIISKNFMKKVDKLTLEKSEKEEFIKEILYFPSKERDEILNDLIKKLKVPKEFK